MQSRTGAVTQVYIAAVLFFAIAASLFCYCRIIFLLLPHHFFLCSANCNEKIAAPRRTRVTNSTKICRTSLVARYAAPPCVTRYAATYIASTVVIRCVCLQIFSRSLVYTPALQQHFADLEDSQADHHLITGRPQWKTDLGVITGKPQYIILHARRSTPSHSKARSDHIPALVYMYVAPGLLAE